MIDRRRFNGRLLLAAGLGLAGPGLAGGAAWARDNRPDAKPDTKPDARAASGTLSDPAVCTVIQDVESGDTLVRDGACERRYSPCSTFKLPLALIGFDAGILQDAHTPLWPYRAALKAPAREHKDTDPTVWLRDSIVWYSQELTRKLGDKRFAAYVNALDYGNRDVSGNPGKGDGLTQSWLMSSLRISPDEQVRLLRRSLTRTLPVSPRACDLTHACLPVFQAPDGWTVHGKTGSGTQADAAGRRRADRPQGWFVGWAEKAGQRIVFARLEVGDRPTQEPGGPRARDALLAQLPALLARG